MVARNEAGEAATVAEVELGAPPPLEAAAVVSVEVLALEFALAAVAAVIPSLMAFRLAVLARQAFLVTTAQGQGLGLEMPHRHLSFYQL